MKSLSHKLFHATAPVKEIPEEMFSELIKCVKFSRLNENEFEYRGKYNNYEIGFALINGILDVDVFGKWHKNTEWIELDPTNKQYDSMKKKIESVEFEKEYEPLEYKDPYYENGVNRNYFY